VKKKYPATNQDKLDWANFIKNPKNIYNKDKSLPNYEEGVKKIPKIDLHGMSLSDANKKIKKFIIQSVEQGYKKILVVTGKGLRSKVYNDPYRSEDMNVLKNSIPNYIKNDYDLTDKIIKITKADLKNGGDGAIYVYLKQRSIVIE